jgi:hypothetical protein
MDRENGSARRANDLLRDAPEQEVLEACIAPRADQDQVGLESLRAFRDGLGRAADLEVSGHDETDVAHAFRGLLQALLAGFAQDLLVIRRNRHHLRRRQRRELGLHHVDEGDLTAMRPSEIEGAIQCQRRGLREIRRNQDATQRITAQLEGIRHRVASRLPMKSPS